MTKNFLKQCGVSAPGAEMDVILEQLDDPRSTIMENWRMISLTRVCLRITLY